MAARRTRRTTEAPELGTTVQDGVLPDPVEVTTVVDDILGADTPVADTGPALPDPVEGPAHPPVTEPEADPSPVAPHVETGLSQQDIVDMLRGVLEHSPANPTLVRWVEGGAIRHTLVDFGGPGMAAAWSIYTAHRPADVGAFLGLVAAVRPVLTTVRTVTVQDLS